jgi:hypothetical protein
MLQQSAPTVFQFRQRAPVGRAVALVGHSFPRCTATGPQHDGSSVEPSPSSLDNIDALLGVGPEGKRSMHALCSDLHTP